jgi:hypothetical protein
MPSNFISAGKFVINPDLISMIDLGDKEQVTVYAGGSAVTVEGEDAANLRKQYGPPEKAEAHAHKELPNPEAHAPKSDKK